MTGSTFPQRRLPQRLLDFPVFVSRYPCSVPGTAVPVEGLVDACRS